MSTHGSHHQLTTRNQTADAFRSDHYRVEQLAKAQNMIPPLAFENRDNRLTMQDIIDDDETENAYIPTDDADSTLYYDQEVSLTQTVDTHTAIDTEDNNNMPHNDMPTDMIHLNDTATASTMTNEITTPTGTGNNQVIPLPDITEKDDQNVDIQNPEDDIVTPMNTSHDESNQKDEQQDTAPAPVENIADTTMEDEMNAKYGT